MEEEGQRVEVVGDVTSTRAFSFPAGQWPGLIYFMIPEKAKEMRF